MKQIFRQPVINTKDAMWLGVSILLFVIFYFEFLSNIASNTTNAGNIYLPLYLFAVVIYGIALATKNRGTFNLFNYGYDRTAKDLYKAIAVGAVFGVVLVFGYLNSNNLLSIFSPPILAIAGTAALGTYLTLAIVQIFGAETEEFAIQSAFIPTILKLLKSGSELPIIFFMFGLFFLVTPLIQSTIIALTLIVLAVIFTFNPKLNGRFSNSQILRFIAAFTVGAFIFALFHIYAYGQAPNATQLFISAFLFSIIDSSINYYMGSTTAGKVAHSINNGFIFSIVNGIALQIPLLIEGIYILIIVISFKYSSKSLNVVGG